MSPPNSICTAVAPITESPCGWRFEYRRANGPRQASALQGEQAKHELRTAGIVEVQIRPDEHDDAEKSEDEADEAAARQSLAVGAERFHSRHEEW